MAGVQVLLVYPVHQEVSGLFWAMMILGSVQEPGVCGGVHAFYSVTVYGS